MLEIDCKHLLFDKRSKTFIGKLRDLRHPNRKYARLKAPIMVVGNQTSKTFHLAHNDDPDGPYYFSFVDSDNVNGLYSLELYSKDEDMAARWNSLRGKQHETTSR